jgi:beta-lactamase class A
MKRSAYLTFAALCIVSLAIGGALGWALRGPSIMTLTPLREGGYNLIRPILLCNLPNGVQNQSNEDPALTAKIQKYISGVSNADIGVYYSNPTLSKRSGVNENTSFSPASMLKVPIMVAILRSAEDHPELLSKKVFYDGSFNDNALEDIRPQKALEAGHLYTVDELLSYMIKYSDNNATHLLHDQLTAKEFEDIYTDLGIEVPTVNGPVDFMSAKTFILFLRVLYNGTYLSHQDSEKALELMTVNDFPAGLKGGVPDSVTVAQKFGERVVYDQQTKTSKTELHNCGIIYPEKGPYLLCVMTRGNDFNTLSKEIRDISEIVYNHVNSK